MTVFLTGGHTYQNSQGTGAHANGWDEAEEARLFVTDLAKELWHNYGIMAITDKDDWSLSEVVRRIGQMGDEGDLLLDFHFNAASASAHGSEVFIADDATPGEQKAGRLVLEAIIDSLGTRNRGVKAESDSQWDSLAMLSNYPISKLAGVLVELAFLTNQEDMQKFKEHRQLLIENLAETIAELHQNGTTVD